MLYGPKLTLIVTYRDSIPAEDGYTLAVTKRAQRLTTRIPRGLLPTSEHIRFYFLVFFYFFQF